MPVRLVGRDLLRGGRPVVALRWRRTVRGGATVVAGGRRSVVWLVWRRAAATEAVALIVLDHHLDVALGIVGRFSHAGESDAASGGVGARVRLGGDLDAATGAVLELFDGGTALADDQTHLVFGGFRHQPPTRRDLKGGGGVARYCKQRAYR